MKKKIALLMAVLMLALVIPISTPAGADTLEGPTSFVRVRLSTGETEKITITVSGTYRIVESNETFTGGKLTVTAVGSTVKIVHSSRGELYSGTAATIERADLARTAGYLTLPVAGYSRSYLGHLSVTASGSRLQVVNRVPLSHYLYGVVAYEMSNSFPVEALKAQAIAAKNYVLPRMGGSGAYDIGDTSTDQVYKGYNSANKNVIEAVDATMNDVLLLGGAVMPCYYSASNGGYMVKPSANWSGGAAYDAGYSEGYDEYDMKNSASPRETLYVPTEFTKENVGNDVFYALVTDALTAALELPETIPEGYLFEKLLRISNVVSVDDNGGMAGLDHTAAVFTAVVAVQADAENPPATPTPEPTTEPTPEPTAEPTTAPTAPPTAEPQQAAAAPSAEPTVQPTTEPAAEPAAEPTAEPTAAPTAPPTPEPTAEPTEAPGITLADTLGTSAEVPVTFTIPFSAMQAAGMFEKTNLRIYYASPAEGGFVLLHARYGHGVGLSQRGAQQMAAEGKTYREILAYYYGGAALSGYAYTLPENIPADPETPGPATPAPATAAAFVKGSDVNLRKSASSSSASLARLRDRTALTVSGLSGAWYAVRVDATGQTGYIHSDYVTLSSDTPLANGFVNASAVNIRRGNSTRTESLGRLDRNTKLTIYGMVKGWYRVRVDASGLSGYIIQNYVTVTTAAAVPPAGGATSTPDSATPAPTPSGTASPSPTAKPTPTPGEFTAYGEINATQVNFRTGPSTSTVSMGKLDRPERLGIYEKTGSWYRVRLLSQGKDGYVYAKYVTLTGSGSSGTGEQMGSGQINASAVNIRTGPSTSYTSLGKLARRTELTVLGSSGSWYRVRVNATGLEGFVFGKYVSLQTTGSGTGTSRPQTGQGTINTGLLNLRDKPSTGSDSTVLLSMRLGYTVTVHSISGEWAYVTYNGTKGYCIAKCIEMK